MLRYALTALLLAVPAGGEEMQGPSAAQSSQIQPSQAQIEAATDLLKANNAAANITAAIDAFLPIEAAAIHHDYPNADSDTVAKLLDVVRDSIKSHEDEVIRIYAIAYAQHFTLEELRSLTGFYRSDVGQKYLREVQDLNKDVAPLTITYMQKLVSQAIQDAAQAMRA